jgi:hypothetical protein
VLLIAYVGILLFGMNQKGFYIDLVRGMRKPAPLDENVLISA